MGFLGLERPFLDLVSQTPRPRGGGRPLFAQQEILLELISKLSPLHLNSEIPRICFSLNFWDVNIFEALLSEVRPYQQTNLE